MATDPRAQRALNRLGLIPKSGASTVADLRAFLLADLDNPSAGQIDKGELLGVGEAFRAARGFREQQKADREARAAERALTAKSAEQRSMSNSDPVLGEMKPGPTKRGPGVPQQIYLQEAKARLDAALEAEVGFVERLVWFWSNHFCVSADKGQVRPLCGAFEREAIRPHVRGKFSDLLFAVESHPAMLFYLDNVQSIGPNSFAGIRRGKGINENLAREIMELHTVGVRTGYTQTDVTNFAKVITGWTITPARLENGGEFMFNPRLHEPGAELIMGRNYAENGVEQGRAVLLELARSEATAQHIASKLARHFVADEPQASLVTRLAKRFHDTDGDLTEVSRTLITAPEVWDTPPGKLRRPFEWLVNSLRALNLAQADVRPVLNALNLLGEPLWRPPAPNGFSDESSAWMDGLAQRLDIANQFVRRAAALDDPESIAEHALGPLLSAETRQTVARAESRPQALALLLMAPEFQRR